MKENNKDKCEYCGNIIEIPTNDTNKNLIEEKSAENKQQLEFFFIGDNE